MEEMKKEDPPVERRISIPLKKPNTLKRIPRIGDTLNLEGTEYTVISADRLKGRFVAQLKK